MDNLACLCGEMERGAVCVVWLWVLSSAPGPGRERAGRVFMSGVRNRGVCVCVHPMLMSGGYASVGYMYVCLCSSHMHAMMMMH